MLRRPRMRVTAPHSDEVVTKQSMKDECDIHRILRQYQRTGILQHVQAARPTYGDLPAVGDYQAALNTMIEADTAFAALPAKVREHFRNSPAELLAALADPAQAEKLREFGILRPKEEPHSLAPLARPPEGAPAAS